eukprot:381921-Pelagomonas_calceolata.AAC.2
MHKCALEGLLQISAAAMSSFQNILHGCNKIYKSTGKTGSSSILIQLHIDKFQPLGTVAGNLLVIRCSLEKASSLSTRFALGLRVKRGKASPV